MTQNVKGHYRGGKWIPDYTRREKEEAGTPYRVGLFEDMIGPDVKEGVWIAEDSRRDSKWNKEYCECCEGRVCCPEIGCNEPLTLQEANGEVGLRLPKWHMLCQGCLWDS